MTKEINLISAKIQFQYLTKMKIEKMGVFHKVNIMKVPIFPKKIIKTFVKYFGEVIIKDAYLIIRKW